MKRLVGYISVVLSMFLALLVGLVPALKGVDATGDYESMHQYVYKISEKSYDISSGGTSDDGNISEDEKKSRLDDTVEIFKNRLDTANISDYSLETSGLDTIKVSFKVDNSLYDDVASYLNFSWSFMASTYTGDPAVGQEAAQIASNSGNDNFFDTGNARIEYRDNYPYVVIPLKDPEAFKQVFVAAKDAEAPSDPSTEDDSSEDSTEEETTANENKIFILNDWVTGLSIESLLSETGNEFVQDKEVKEHILFEFDATNPSSFYWDYDSTLSTDDQNNAVYEEIYFGGYNLLDSSSEKSYYGSTETDRVLAYQKASIWLGKFNSENLDYQVTLINVNGDNNTSTIIPPFYDYLVFMNEINWSNGLFVGTLIATIVVSLFLILNYGLNGVSAILNAVAIFISSIGLFNAFGSEFNIGAILGLLSVVVISLFSSTIYFKKIKDEAYLGKNLRKAYQDGSKKALVPQVDISVITLILGITAYLIPNSIMISFGSLLIIGSIINILLSGILLRALTWLLFNSSVVLNKPGLVQIERKYMPNLSKDEKPRYFEQFNKKASPKFKKTSLIVASVMLLASVIGLTTFQLVRGNIYNDTSSTSGSEIVVRIDQNNVYEDDSLEIQNYSDLIEGVFEERLYSDQENLLVDNPTVSNYNYEYKFNNVINKEYYFVVDLDGNYDASTSVYYLDNNGNMVNSTLEEAVNVLVMNVVPANKIDVNVVENVNNDSNNYYALIFASIGIAISSIYMLFRFNLSKTITSILVIGGSLTITVGIFSLINGPFVSTITLGILFLTLIGYMMEIIYFTKEKEVYSEKRKELQDLTLRRDAYEVSGNNYYNYLLNTTLLASFIIISMFFAPSIDHYLLILILVGMVILILGGKCLSLSIESYFTSIFNKLKLSINAKMEKHNQKSKKKDKKNDDGPEEAIFVGIND